MRKKISVSMIPRRLLSLLLALVLAVTLLPGSLFPSAGAASGNVTVYFSNTDGWSDVYGYVWDSEGDTPAGAWPGQKLTADTNGLYELTLKPDSGALNFIFNNNNGLQTADLSLSSTQLSSGNSFWVNGASGKPTVYAPPSFRGNKVTFTYTGTGSNVYVAGSFNSWSSSAAKMTKSGSTFTYTCELKPGRYEYKFVVDGSWINDPGNPLITGSDKNNFILVPGLADTTITAVKGITNRLPTELGYVDETGKEQLRAVTYTLQGSPSGVSLSGHALSVTSGCALSSCTLTAATANGYSCTVTVKLVAQGEGATTVKLHFIDSLGWNGVAASLWTKSGSSTASVSGYGWPGQVLQRDEKGFYTLELTHYPVSGQSLGYNFHNNSGAQTQDLSISASELTKGNVELWIQPTGSVSSEKYACTVTSSLAAQFRSVEVNGSQVTFRYKSTTASKVYVAGSFNSWSTSAGKMTKSGSTFSYTTTLSEGIHEYKFIVDGEWILDPRNGNVGGYDGNNIVIVGDYAANNTGKVTVKLHYYRSGSYTGWDAWMWCANQDGAAYTLASDTKGRVATITVDGKINSYVNYILRKTNWSEQEFYDRSIDLSKVVSGTVHYYVNSGQETGHLVYGPDVVFGGKPTNANYDYESGRIWVKTSLPLSGTLSTAFSLVNTSGKTADVTVTGVSVDNGGYSLTLSRRVNLSELRTLQVKCGSTCTIQTEGLFFSDAFAQDYTYTGGDLGATWSKSATTFKVWAPTATGVSVMLYKGGNYGGNDWISTTAMKLGEQGVWEVTIKGDLNGKYYNYLVEFPGYSCEATDPYADSTGANGDRGMILNMDSTDPAGWTSDISPNQGMSYTDAIIYEMHIREMTIDSSSGIKSAWKGKYLGLTQEGTSYQGYATGLDHLKELGITHVQLMPTYDYNSVDEYHLTDWQQYAWGYDPRNYNVPEGSYSTDPFNGEVRVKEFKQMVQSFHSNGINVIMDVVYNHAFSGGDFCYNKIVPTYFSRFWGDGSWSNGSGCGNDIATERAMTRQYIVDSIMHWVEEYHIDGFRFDLAGLIDTQTINEIVNTVHAQYPYVMFYGEGWAPGDTAVQEGYSLANQGNAWMTPGFGHFNDGFRNAIAGDNGNYTGFASGAGDKADAIGNYFRASNGWSGSPTQTINYASCHDNYCLMDKLCISRNGAYWDQLVDMNNLSAAIYMLAQGTPFIYSGEELLREKKNEDGYRIDNAHGTNDYVNKIRWSDLKNKTGAQVTDDYYAGLVEFRKNHAALRCANGADAWNYVKYHKINDHCILFYVDGYPNYECSDGIVIIYNAQESTQWVNIYDYGVPSGTWQACIHGDEAGTTALWSTTNGSVGVEGISATVLVKGDLVDENSIYNRQETICRHPSHSENGVCADCGVTVSHSFSQGKCTVCGKADPDYVAPAYYLFGYINGANYACEDDYQNMGEYKFVNGKLTTSFKSDSYIAIKEEDNAAWYMASAYIQDTAGTFYNTDTGTYEKMFVPGGVELTFTLTENADGSLTLSYEKAVTSGTLSGSITSGTNTTGPITVELWAKGASRATYTVTTQNGAYSMENVAAGTYTMTVSKANHVKRSYTVTIDAKAVKQDAKICLLGDVTGDGVVDSGDVASLYAHVKGSSKLTDKYVLDCANVSSDSLNIGDVAMLYAHVKGSKPLL